MQHDRWQRLMRALGLAANEATFASLSKAHAQDHRHYHNADHIAACLKHLDDVSEFAEKPLEIETALWFHDAVYDQHSSSNERDSADWAIGFLRENAVPEDVVSRIDRLIMVTAGHGVTSSIDEDLMIDIDLSILGESPEAYDRFETAIRKEYNHVPDALFSQKRGEILMEFLGREQLYRTQHFIDNFQSQARINLANAIAAL